jgi:hypothetical protein
MAQKFTLYYYVKVWIIFVHDYVNFNAFQVIQRFFKTTIYPWWGHYGIHTQLRYQKGMTYFLKIVKDNFEFLFILHYYSCSGLLYVNRLNDVFYFKKSIIFLILCKCHFESFKSPLN